MPKQTLILGGPGTGKTYALIEIVREKLEEGFEPEEIAYLAFTRKAAYEARSRTCETLDLAIDRLTWFRTLHSFTFKSLGLDPGHVMGGPDYVDLGESLNMTFTSPKADDNYGLHLGASEGEQLARLEQFCRVTGERLEDASRDAGIDSYKARYYERSLRAFKKERYLLDFTDMIETFILANEQNKDIKIVIVDEAQDLSPIHWRALQSLFKNAQEVYIGGDDDQSIFQWAGADVKQFLQLNGERRVLPVSHRLPESVFHLAEKISRRIKNRIQKLWRPRNEEGAIHCIDSADSLDFEKGNWLLLARNNYQLSTYIATLRRRGFPYECYGKSSIDRDTAKWIDRWKYMQDGGKIYDKLEAKLKKKTRYVFRNEDLEQIAQKYEWYTVIDLSDAEIRYYQACLRRNRNALSVPPNIRVSTIHGAKGGEAENVVLSPDLSKAAYDSLENPRTADAEHRVFYVGVTRARERLYLLYPRSNRYYTI